MIPFDHLSDGNACATAPEPTPSDNGTTGATGHEAPPTPGNGRDARGRFAAGNRGGPGNPFARQTAAFRRALCAAVTEEEITMIVTILLDMAKAGDLAAIKLLLAYVVGRPVETVDPDTLDLQEWRQWSAAPDDPQNLVQVMTSPDTGMLCELARSVRPTMTQTFNRMMLGGLNEQAQRDARRAARKEKRRAQQSEAPMANGDDGVAAVAPPIANGDNGPPPAPPPPMANGGNGAEPGSAPLDPLPPGLLKLVGAMLGRAFGARPPEDTTG